MNAIEKRARELLADEFARSGELVSEYADEVRSGITHPWDRAAIRAIISALTPPEGHVVVTRNEAGQAVAVTRQDDEGRILSVIAEFEAPDGYVLVPVEPTEEMLDAGRAAVMAEHCAGPKWTPRQHFEASGRSTAGIPEDVLDERGPLTKESTAAMVFGVMLAARPEVIE